MKGSTLNFKKESAAFAKALQAEHGALGDLIEWLKSRGPSVSPDAKPWTSEDAVIAAEKAHEAVRFQRTRTEMSVGRR